MLADRAALRRFAGDLGDWYRREGRTLEVRATADPWAVLVAETMSQQTQIARVGPFWRRFIDRWPTPAALAAASTPDLLAAWAGLGYNRRALALRDAARRIVAEHGGVVPSDIGALQALPGVGPYTARAVAASAFGMPVAPVDVNVRRVVSRFTGLSGARAVQDAADRLIGTSASGPAVWVHAVMDLAATICVRRHPACDRCPVAAGCVSRGTMGDEPSRRPVGGADGSATRSSARSAAVPFRRTNRWLRGRLVARAREAAPGSWVVFDGPIGDHDSAAVIRALAGLAAEGFIEVDGDLFRLRA
ncbi:MAG: A/G-specific adenine glycosylase [Chloroflexi bacterium]|nr:A/G-specific adenine glycosylase [Chloroflexota bacterium]